MQGGGVVTDTETQTHTQNDFKTPC